MARTTPSALRNILVATDFSSRSDRALRRAVLLARQSRAALCLVHVVDDDRPAPLVAAEREAAERLLGEMVRTLGTVDGLQADSRVVLAEPSAGIPAAADALDADLIVVGVPRPQVVRDVFVGTTVERIIRGSRRPTLLACGVPSGFYEQILVSTDLSEGSAHAVRALGRLGLDRMGAVTAVYVFDAVLPTLTPRDGAIREQAEAWIAAERDDADASLTEFLAPLGLALPRRLVRLNRSSVAQTLIEAAGETGADVIATGSRGRSGLGGRLLGSVTVELLRNGAVDVLVVPPPVEATV